MAHISNMSDFFNHMRDYDAVAADFLQSDDYTHGGCMTLYQAYINSLAQFKSMHDADSLIAIARSLTALATCEPYNTLYNLPVKLAYRTALREKQLKKPVHLVVAASYGHPVTQTSARPKITRAQYRIARTSKLTQCL